MFARPAQFQEYLTHHGLINDVYLSMESPDYADVVITVLDILKKTKQLPVMVKQKKSEAMSTALRSEGNQAYAQRLYQQALLCYNKALLFAPTNSRVLKLAYSNRSALLHTMKEFSACIADIDTCFALGCPTDIIDKLKKRKEEAKNSVWMEYLAEDARSTNFAMFFFRKHLMNSNALLKCASSDVDIVIESNLPKVVATSDIKVGAVVALEKAFVSHTDVLNSPFSCYYCHKMSLNLQPCEQCCVALFCSTDCKDICMREYHEIECQIIEVVEAVSQGSLSRMAIKAVLKMRSLSKSWQELVSASSEMGIKRIKKSPVNQIYDSNYKFSLLNMKDEKHFLHGSLYNTGFKCAIIMNYLENVSCFLPQTGEQRSAAIHAVARMMMFLSLFSTHTQIIVSLSVSEHDKINCHDNANYGWFSFTSKLRHCCNPNLLAFGLNKEIALVAAQPIKRGTELTISYMGHWLDDSNDKQIRQRNMLTLYGMVCNCTVCTEEYKKTNYYTLTELQQKTFRKLNLDDMKERFSPKNVPEFYMKLCKALAFLHDLPHSREYSQVYELFRKCLLYLQDIDSGNVILSYT